MNSPACPPHIPSPYTCDEKGVHLLEATGTRRVAVRPIYVEALCQDISTNKFHAQLVWQDLAGNLQNMQIAAAHLSDKKELLALSNSGAAINNTNYKEVGHYLQATFDSAKLPIKKSATKVGWQGNKLILPDAYPDVLVQGFAPANWEPKGNASVARAALHKLLTWGATPALAVTAASAAAPAVRLLGLVRSPVLQLCVTSGTGKSSAARFAVSLWANPEFNSSLYINSFTAKGLFAKLMSLQDMPVALDDVQLLAQEDINKLVYSLADGSETLRADRTGAAREADAWRGVAILTSEQALLAGAVGKGAVNRSIELSDNPLGMPKGPEGAARAELLRDAALHYATLRGELLALYGDTTTLQSALRRTPGVC